MDLIFNDDVFALVQASSCGNTTLVKQLLDDGADIEAELYAGITPIYMATYAGDLDLLILLHQRGANLEHKSLDESTPLLTAAQYGHLKIVQYLTSNHVNIDVKNDYGSTALYLATRNEQTQIVKHLIDAGATLNIFNQDGESPLSTAHQLGFTEIQQMLFDAEINGPITKLHKAAYIGDILGAKESLNAGVDINAMRAIDGATAIVFAVNQGKAEMLSFLIEQGADTKIMTKGVPLIGLAAQDNHIEVAEILIANGVNPKVIYKNKTTPLSIAIKRGHLEMVKTLTKHGAGVKHSDQEDFCAYHAEICNSNQEQSPVIEESIIILQMAGENNTITNDI